MWNLGVVASSYSNVPDGVSLFFQALGQQSSCELSLGPYFQANMGVQDNSWMNNLIPGNKYSIWIDKGGTFDVLWFYYNYASYNNGSSGFGISMTLNSDSPIQNPSIWIDPSITGNIAYSINIVTGFVYPS